MSDEWAERLAKKINDRQADREQSDQLSLQRQSALKAQVPHLWNELYAALQEKIRIVNARVSDRQPYFQFSPATEGTGSALIESPDGKFEVVFVSPFNLVSIYRLTTKDVFSKTEKEPKGTLRFDVTNGDVWIQTEDGQSLSVPDAAQHILETLFGREV